MHRASTITVISRNERQLVLHTNCANAQANALYTAAKARILVTKEVIGFHEPRSLPCQTTSPYGMGAIFMFVLFFVIEKVLKEINE